MRKVLIINSHPDDEVISAGGTIRKLKEEGCKVSVLIFATGNEGYSKKSDREKIVKIRIEEREKAGAILGVDRYFTCNYNDFQIPKNEETFKECIRIIREVKPDIIFTHWWAEYMTHRHVATVATEAWWQAMWKCSLDLGMPWRAEALYHFSVLDILEKPTHIVDISDTFKAKIKAMKIYKSQHAVLGQILQQIESRASYYGSLIGVRYGEAFIRSGFVPTPVIKVKELF